MLKNQLAYSHQINTHQRHNTRYITIGTILVQFDTVSNCTYNTIFGFYTKLSRDDLINEQTGKSTHQMWKIIIDRNDMYNIRLSVSKL